MEILHVIPYFSPQMGGPPEVVHHVSQHLVRLGHTVTVVTTDYALSNAHYPALDYSVRVIPNLVAGAGFYVNPGLVPWAQKNIRRFDVIHMHTVRTFQNAVVMHYANRFNKPIILSAHGTLPVIVQRQLPKKIYDLLAGKRLLKSAARFHAVAPIEVSQYQAFGVLPEQVEWIPNGVPRQELAGQVAPVPVQARFDLPPQARLILYLGRLHVRKHIDVLVRACAKILEAGENIALLVVGPDDGDRLRLERLVGGLKITHRVRFVGPVYGVDKWSLLSAGDVFVSPGVHEIFGLAPFEALQCGIPVIVADDDGSGEMFRMADTGYLFRAGSVEALSLAIRHVLDHPEETRQKVQNGQDFIRQRLDWAGIARQYEALYRRVAASYRLQAPVQELVG